METEIKLSVVYVWVKIQGGIGEMGSFIQSIQELLATPNKKDSWKFIEYEKSSHKGTILLCVKQNDLAELIKLLTSDDFKNSHGILGSGLYEDREKKPFPR